jgi:hypothetical protein
MMFLFLISYLLVTTPAIEQFILRCGGGIAE